LSPTSTLRSNATQDGHLNITATGGRVPDQFGAIWGGRGARAGNEGQASRLSLWARTQCRAPALANLLNASPGRQARRQARRLSYTVAFVVALGFLFAVYPPVYPSSLPLIGMPNSVLPLVHFPLARGCRLGMIYFL